MTDLKKFPVKLAFDQDGGKFYVYGSHIVNFDEITAKIDETNTLLTTANASLVDANGHLVDINGNLVEIDGELVSINTVEGSVTDAAVTGDTPGSISAKLRGLNSQSAEMLDKNDVIIEKIEETNALLTTGNSLLVDANGHLVDVNGNLVEIDGELVDVNTVEGSVTDAAVTGDNPGTISAKLRGLTTQTVDLLDKNDTIIEKIEETNALLTTSNSLLVDANGHLVDVNGNLVEIDGDVVSINTVEGLVTDTAVTGDANGTISAKLRGILVQLGKMLIANTFATGQSTLGTTAVQVAAARTGRRSITIVNHSTTDVYIGGSGVTATTGTLLLGTKGASITLESTGAIYGITTAGTPTVSFMEEYNV